MRAGTITNNGSELWLRCPYCGDSPRNPQKGHFAVNIHKGVYNCLRCKIAGRVSDAQLLELSNYTHLFSAAATNEGMHFTEVLSILSPGAATSRRSQLSRYQLPFGEQVLDAFILRDPKDGSEVGVYTRGAKKYSHVYGERGFSWSYDGPLLSSPDHPIRLVEGPYDILTSQDVACYGTISKEVLRPLAGHSVILTPDGDIWTDYDKRASFLNTLNHLMRPGSMIDLVGLELLMDGKDPDEVPVDQRTRLDRREMQAFLLATKSRRKNTSWLNAVQSS
jgi:hypothetical protein